MNLPDDLPSPEDDGGARHLTGTKMPSIPLLATSGVWIDLSSLPGRVVVYAYPMTGVPGVELPHGWNDIPGARGCTPQALSFLNEKDVFDGLGVAVFGVSTQTADYQKELSDRLGLSFVILSDAEFELTEALRLSTMTVEGMRLMKRLTLLLPDNIPYQLEVNFCDDDTPPSPSFREPNSDIGFRPLSEVYVANEASCCSGLNEDRLIAERFAGVGLVQRNS